jgi:bacillithiol system protein YtxJ
MKQLSSSQDLDRVFSEDTAVLYKHSTHCPISAAAQREMESLLEENPAAPLYLVDVHASRDLSDAIVDRTGIEHQSPQLILLRGGEPTWTIARTEITAEALAEQLEDVPA